jgi:hypothetical protein
VEDESFQLYLELDSDGNFKMVGDEQAQRAQVQGWDKF